MEVLAIGATLASTAVSTVGGIAAQERQARAAEQRGRIAAIQGDQAETAAIQDLHRQISNIKAIRASAGGNPDSPTIGAIIADERHIGDQNRRKRRLSAQFEQDQAAADAIGARSMKGLTIASGLVSGLNTLGGL